ncbi:acyl-CoA dehydrogenase family protein [Allonocardiopsis opalescens]|uniref:Alkylation response protein AidB-like acyl-CoA dehydrogenase n=1 Tax=Allonocardiopsis opalescens TaxID=1144618 RepID=A0A2T0PTW2_9ACTN|nr:acyl-CoA dehydrogenase family protein [Allonocardiopsis opalescens]PRX92334.1 hypothetical protein CLV72_11094 [Allonocardiopsis opalescens]
MGVRPLLPTSEAGELLELTAEIGAGELAPRAAAAEAEGAFPREVFRTLGRAGLLGLPYPEQHGGAGQPYTVYLRVLEELAAHWLAVALGVSVHTLTCYPLAAHGTPDQRERWLGEMLGGELLGAYALSEPQAGSDAAALSTRAAPEGEGYAITGAKAWITHGGVADYYTLFARTGGPDSRGRGISCFHLPAPVPGLTAAAPERKMGMSSSPTCQLALEAVPAGADQRVGAEGEGFAIAMAALDAGRLGIAACSVGLARAALDLAVDYAGTRTQFGRPVAAFQGVSFLLADMATQVEAARALYLEAARTKDAGLPYTRQAAMAKLFASDTAMRVTTDAVQVLGGYGYTADFPAERYMREAKVLQIVEGTNQIQRLVIGRELCGAP